MIPIVDLKSQYREIKSEVTTAIGRTLGSCQFILGREVKKLEKEIAGYTKKNYAVAVGSGTDAILLALKAYGIKEGHGVITSPFTYYATAGAIVRSGARPVFCDIDPKTYNISPERLQDLLRRTPYAVRSTIKAVIPVHLYGQMADMSNILDIAKRYKLKVIEDAAQAFGAEYRGRPAGSLGDCGCFSFYPGKNLGAYGDAGMVVTDHKYAAEAVRLYRNQGNKIRYRHTVIGHNSRMDEIQAAVLRVKLKYIDKWNRKRREIAEFYEKGLSGLDIETPVSPKAGTHIYHLYVIRFKNKRQKDRTGKLLNYRGIDARTYYPIPLHLQPCFKYLGYKRGDFPESEKASGQVIAIPIYPELTRKQQRFIIDVLRKGI